MKMPEERPYRTTSRRQSARSARKTSKTGLQLIAVQSISCVVVIAIVLAFRLAGGNAFAQLRESFNRAMMDNSFVATLMSLFEKEPAGGVSSAAAVSSGESQTEGTASRPTSDSVSGPNSGGEVSAETSGTTAAVGGKDIAVQEKKALYAPEGATFAKLQANSMGRQPLPTGKVTSYFGYREDPIHGGDSFHLGVDIAAAAGTPACAMFYGVVTETGESASYGNYIKIYHGGGMEVLYAHCAEILAQKDAVIRAGEVVAKVGSTGDSTGNHLHVEVRVDGIAYDPADILPMDLYD